MLRCESCGREFDRPHSRGPSPRFCGNNCRQRAHKQRHRKLRPTLIRAAAVTGDDGVVTIWIPLPAGIHEGDRIHLNFITEGTQ